MASRAKKMDIDIRELGASDRTFQIGRDTFLIYVALQLGDEIPFVRVGSGEAIPENILSHIGGVILPEKSPANIGTELQWLDASASRNQKKIRYIGSKDQIKQLEKLSKFKYSASKNRSPYSLGNELDLPLETEVFGPPSKGLAKNKVTVNQMRDGNFVIYVGNKRIFDHSAIDRGRISLDREYALLEETLSKQSCRLERTDKRSFIWLGRENSIDAKRPFLYWNLRNTGLLINPCFNYHQVLFEERIHTRRAKSFLSYSGEEAGFIEGIRRQDACKGPAAFFSSNENLLPILKKFYPNTSLQQFSDGDPVPFAPDTSFFASRNHSHIALSWSFSPQAEQITQLLFPLGGKRSRRSFDVIRAPHDLEVQIIDSREDFKESLAHIALQLPGDYPKALFQHRRLKAGAYPLLAHKEYVLHESLEAKPFAAEILRCLQAIPEHDLLREFLIMHFGNHLSPAMQSKSLKALRKIKIPLKDFAARHNLWSYFEFIKSLPAYDKLYRPASKRSLQYLSQKFSPLQTSYKQWLSLEKKPVEFHIFLLGARRAFLFTRQIKADPLAYKMPPSLDELAENPRAYARQLRLWERALGRHGDPKGFRSSLEMLEKMYEEKLRLLDEKKRFENFAHSLGLGLGSLGLDSKAKAKSTNIGARLLHWRESLAGSFLEKKGNWGGSLTEILAPSLRFVPIALLTCLLLFGAVRALAYFTGGTSEWGDSSSELAATRLVPPGELQSDEEVPGEDEVETPVSEIFQYVNVLARNNGFRLLRSGEVEGGENPRDIDLVFPGDTLRLPDRRLAKIERGDHVWDIARDHYRKDFSRMQIMQRQIYVLVNEKNISAPEKQRNIRQKQVLMRRLAVTTQMRALLRETNEGIREASAR